MDVASARCSSGSGGRRSVVSASGEYVPFGRSETDEIDPITGPGEGAVDDNYYRLEAAYTYRLLRLITEFSLRIGCCAELAGPGRGRRNHNPEDCFNVGLNYGAPRVRFRLADIWHLEGEFLTSVTEVGFSVGAGGALLIGDPYGSKLTLGFEIDPGLRRAFYSRLDIGPQSGSRSRR